MRDELISGGPALDALLSTLPSKIHANILRAALSAGAAVFKREVLAQVPRGKTGKLAKSVRVSSRIQGRKGIVSASVKAGNASAPYAESVEFGTREHTIVGKVGHSLVVNGRNYEAVLHPGAKKRPFMRVASANAHDAAMATVQAKIRERLTKAGLNASPPLPMDPEE